MYFKKLELIGFKSFAEKTILHFEPGITVVVGPNGCGKSNLYDSIRWVLGEQSIKELRGSNSQDVIFNGSDNKEPLGMAEVSLTFDNTNRHFNLDHNDVVITRRIFRSGESEYLLNKQPVRLKDILDLLIGTGIGAESYSLVQQGKIDLLLSSRPEDRRLVFDEASGITKYKAQKKETLKKLEETEQNLLRLNDIIVEVKRQIGSLERQANKARKYKEVFEELKTKEINLAIQQKDNLLEAKNELIRQIEDLELKEADFLNEIRRQESKITDRSNEIKGLENSIAAIKLETLNLENDSSRSRERIRFNQERITELAQQETFIQAQIEQAEKKVIQDNEKLDSIKEEYTQVGKTIAEKTLILTNKENELKQIALLIKESLEYIAWAKIEILDLVTKIANLKNHLGEVLSKQQIHLSRQKRLEIEKVKVGEEKSVIEDSLRRLTEELGVFEKEFSDLNLKLNEEKKQLESETATLNNINSDIQNLENQTLSLQSQKEFLRKLEDKYEGMGEAMNTLIYLDKLPIEQINGLVVKLKSCFATDQADSGVGELYRYKLSGEAKPIDLNTNKIDDKITEFQHKIDSLKIIRNLKKSNIEGLNHDIVNLEALRRDQEINLTDKRAIQKNILEKAGRIKEELDIINLELSDVENELISIEEKINGLKIQLLGLEKSQKEKEESILSHENSISLNNSLKEKALVLTAQARTEKEALLQRMNLKESTLRTLKDSYDQDQENFRQLQTQLQDVQNKHNSGELEIKDLTAKIARNTTDIEIQKKVLKEKEAEFEKINRDSTESFATIESQRRELDVLKSGLYELQLKNKDLDFKCLSLKERILQGYKVDLDSLLDSPTELEENILSMDIQHLKEKLDSYGTVNLVAIQEYDELKKRYDFLNQQQNDLTAAKESLHSAILKINRTTKQKFLETFEKVRVEFRNYFRLLFGGGDAQLFLIDEEDVLESGIEIICRPPGKKLQNVLLLSGGEKSLSAIALIFAIFKIKPAPFCVLDEIDAALDEANVERYAKLLHEFIQQSQFIVITHNKRTIANADIMYGITMQEEGVSKIVSVKFAKDKAVREKENQPDISPVAQTN